MKLAPILAQVRMKLAPIFHIKISFETRKLTDCLFRQAQNIFFQKHKQSYGSISPSLPVASILGRTLALKPSQTTM